MKVVLVSTLAGALAIVKLHISLAYVEYDLRSSFFGRSAARRRTGDGPINGDFQR